MTTWTQQPIPLYAGRFANHTFTADMGGHTVTRSLNDIMEFEHVVSVDEHGNVSDDNLNLYAPETLVVLDSDGQMISSDSREGVAALDMPIAPWVPLSGYTGQHGSTGKSFIMHESESIGSTLERDILAKPGFYVAVIVQGMPDSEDPEEVEDDYTVGWAVLYREAETGGKL